MDSGFKARFLLSSLKRLTSQSTQISSRRALVTSQPTLQHENRGWLTSLLGRKIEPTKESHSSILSDKEIIYELQTHNIRPGTADQYLKNYEQFANEVHNNKDLDMDLCGSWSVHVGDQDQCVHLWRYNHGYEGIDTAKTVMDADKPMQILMKERLPYLRSRHNQYLLAFSFWPTVDKREGPNIYEIRSYFLKPGSMIEWGNNWARAITFRQSHNEAFGGFFSQVGRLYNVHHIWCYKSLDVRSQNRVDAWMKPGWDSVVQYTVPLIDKYHCKILYSNSFSPTH